MLFGLLTLTTNHILQFLPVPWNSTQWPVFSIGGAKRTKENQYSIPYYLLQETLLAVDSWGFHGFWMFDLPLIKSYSQFFFKATQTSMSTKVIKRKKGRCTSKLFFQGPWVPENTIFKMVILRGTWVAHMVKRPTLAQVMISRFMGSSRASSSALTVQSLEPAGDSVSPSLSDPRPLTPCLSLSKINTEKKFF